MLAVGVRWALISLVALGYSSAAVTGTTHVIPRPFSTLASTQGELEPGQLRAVHCAPEVQAIGALLAEALRREAHITLPVRYGPYRGRVVSLVTDTAREDLGDEGYELTVTSMGVRVTGHRLAGVYYGAQTLLQMVSEARRTGSGLLFGRVVDRPRYPWRGLMLDCSRCFLHVDFLRRYIDLMARYKLNVLHLHLTDDQGWRPFIDAYPRLTEVGALHASNQNLEGGYYTKEELREIVAYAAARFITVVPEIESPGHSLAALAAYPWLGCSGEDYEVPYNIDVFQDVMCPGRESTFGFLEQVWTEMLEVFPSGIVHLGGDEVTKIPWTTCPDCQARMVQEGLGSTDELQSYFVSRVVDMLAAKGRRAIGWDEILEGGLAPGALVMSWRGIQGGIEAARMGHDVVMSPTTHCYFDYPMVITDLAKTYSYDPTPAELTPAESEHILGVQANMWTHLVPQEGIDAQIFPRLLALAEVAWSSPERDYTDFLSRVQAHLPALDDLGVTYYREPEWLRPARVETSLETYMDNRPVRAYDGDSTDSFFWSASGLVAGDHFTLILDTPVEAERVRVLTSHPPSGHVRDVLLDGVLEVSEDGQSFAEVATFHGGDAEAELDGRRVKAVRIRCLSDQIEWLIIREVEFVG